MRDYLSAWLENKRMLRPSTRLAYRIHIRMYLSPALGDVKLKDLAPSHIEEMYTELLQRDHSDGNAVSASSLTRIHATR